MRLPLASLLVSLLAMLAVGTQAAADWNVRDLGAAGDGIADDTAAFQRALDAAGAAKGGIVNVPAGTWRIAGTLSIPAGVTLQGTFRTPPTSYYGKGPELVGTVLEAYAGRGAREGAPFIRLAGNTATLAGVIIRYPEWKQADVPPVPYPPAVAGEGVEDVAVLDSCIINPYEALYFKNSARMIIRNIFGYPMARGLYIDACYDISRVENCHFWPFGVSYNPADPFCLWVNENGVAFEFARTDWQYVTHTFCFGYGVGYRFSNSENGPCNGSFVGIGADCCRRAVLVEDTQDPGLLITNGEFVGRWGSTDSVTLEVLPEAGGKISLNNCSFWGPIERCVLQQSTKAQLTIIGTNFCHWDNAGIGAPAIQIAAGKAILQGNTFGMGDTHVRVDQGVVSAIVTGNQAEGGFTCDNRAGDRTQLALNEASPVQWPRGSKRHYVVDVGGDGDRPYGRDFHGPEAAPDKPGSADKTMRWSRDVSRLRLPVEEGKTYTISIDANIPPQAVGPDNGLYLDGQPVLPFPDKQGTVTISGKLPRAQAGSMHLELRVKGWVPSQVLPGSTDNRTLGISVRNITMTSGRVRGKCYNANTGAWVEE